MAKKGRYSELIVDRLVVRDPNAASNKTFVIEGGYKEKGEGTAKLHIRTPDGETYVSQGVAGTNGSDGDSAYDTWLANGNDGDEMAFLFSLVGLTGLTGTDGTDGTDGDDGGQGAQGDIGPQGIQGIQGETGTAGQTGDTGPMGQAAVDGIQLGAYLDRETVQRDAGENLIGDTSDINLHFLSNGYENPEYRVMEEEPAGVYTTLADWGVATTPYTITNSDFPATADNKVYVVSVRDSVTTGYMLTQKKTLSCIQNGKDGRTVELVADVNPIIRDGDGVLNGSLTNVNNGNAATDSDVIWYRASSYGYSIPEYRLTFDGTIMVLPSQDPSGWTLSNISYSPSPTNSSNPRLVNDFQIGDVVQAVVEVREQGETQASSGYRLSLSCIQDGKDGTNGSNGTNGDKGDKGDDGDNGKSLSADMSRHTIYRASDGELVIAGNNANTITLSFHEDGFTSPQFYVYKNGVEAQTWTTATSLIIYKETFPAIDVTDTYKVLVREGGTGNGTMATSAGITAVVRSQDGLIGTNGTDGQNYYPNNFDMSLGDVGWSYDNWDGETTETPRAPQAPANRSRFNTFIAPADADIGIKVALFETSRDPYSSVIWNSKEILVSEGYTRLTMKARWYLGDRAAFNIVVRPYDSSGNFLDSMRLDGSTLNLTTLDRSDSNGVLVDIGSWPSSNGRINPKDNTMFTISALLSTLPANAHSFKFGFYIYDTNVTNIASTTDGFSVVVDYFGVHTYPIATGAGGAGGSFVAS
jgi:hypothetical protein